MDIKVFLLKIVIVAFIIGLVAARGGGKGGGGRGGRGGSRGSRGSRSRSYRASRVSSWSSRKQFTAAAIGTIYMSRTMRAKFSDYSDWEDFSPSICQNKIRYPKYNGTTSDNGWFICPIDDESSKYCCGESGKHYCCDYWKKYGETIMMETFGLLIVLGLAAYFCLCR